MHHPILGNLPRAFFCSIKMQLHKAFYEDYGAGMVVGRSTCALCEGYRLCSLEHTTRQLQYQR